MVHRVRFFNPGGNRDKVSRLRVINIAGIDNTITITGVDDRGKPGESEVRITLPAYGARTITAQELEEGVASIPTIRPQVGRLGDGAGKWQLTVSGEQPPDRVGERPIQVMSLLWSRQTRNLTNLSAVGDGNDSNRGGDGTDWIWGGAGDDVLDPGDNDDWYDSIYGSTGNDTIVYTGSGPTAFQWLGYFGLETGIRATINGITNVGRVDKGASGTDTIVDVENPLNAAMNTPPGAFGLGGTPLDDRFDLTLANGQWMDVRGEAGNDTINIRSGRVKVNYRHTPNGVDVDLGAGRANDDGYGGVDTIIGDVFELEGGPGDDTLTGSSGGDRLDGGPGNDTINPRESACNGRDDQIFGSIGDDTIVYTDVGDAACSTLYYGAPWRGGSTISRGQGIDVVINGVTNQGTVRKGEDGTDTLVNVATQLNATVASPHGYTALYGTFSDDTIDLTMGEGQLIGVRGLAGNDTFHLSGSVRLDYRDAPRGIDADLGAGRVNDDGYGGVDTITSPVYEFRGTSHADVIVGSDADERFIGRGGDDRIDGGGGNDLLRFDRTRVAGVQVDLHAGTATGIWDGIAFSYRIANIERIDGSRGHDDLRGSGGDDRLTGREGNDYIEGRGGDDRLEGGSGEDSFVFRPGHGDDRIVDFSGEDLIIIRGLGITKSEVLDAATSTESGSTWIDLRSFGGGTIILSGFSRDDFQASHFLL